MMNRPILATVILSLVFASAGILMFAADQADAEVTPFPSREKVISVTGTATASIEPDLLITTFGVETLEDTASASLSENNAIMTTVVDAMYSLELDDDQLSTSGIGIYPVYESYREPITDRYKQELVGYEVTNTLTVTTEQLDLAADIIDSAVSAGANRVDYVSFALSQEKQLEVKDDLIGKAVLNAKKKAENALEPLNHNIIGVKAVSLSEFGLPSPMFGYSAKFAESASFDSSTPVFSSDQDITTTANVVFLIGAK